MARPARLELATLCLEGRRSIQLSYGRAAESLHSKAFLDRTESIRVDIEFLWIVRGSRFSRRKFAGQMSGLAIRPADEYIPASTRVLGKFSIQNGRSVGAPQPKVLSFQHYPRILQPSEFAVFVAAIQRA
jgi:hypothetical protein